MNQLFRCAEKRIFRDAAGKSIWLASLAEHEKCRSDNPVAFALSLLGSWSASPLKHSLISLAPRTCPCLPAGLLMDKTDVRLMSDRHWIARVQPGWQTIYRLTRCITEY